MSRSLIVRAIIEDSGEFLFVKHVGHNTWNLPGGHVDDNEDVLDATKREIWEELAVKAEIGNIAYVQHLFLPAQPNGHEGGERFELFFYVKNGQDFRHLQLANASHAKAEIADVRFFAPDTIDTRPAFLKTELASFDPNAATKLRIERAL